MTAMNAFTTDHRYEAKITGTERLTPEGLDEIREISLEVANPEFESKVNQSIGVIAPSDSSFGDTLHHRLYSIADLPQKKKKSTSLKILVKRCFLVDDFSGEQYPGLASNYLCDRQVGETITITGPHPIAFKVPEDPSTNLLLIGMGTGIAPFRAFIKHLYEEHKNWKGKVRLFYGARSGLELLYLNDQNGDLTQYYDQKTFKAFQALSPRPHWSDPIALDQAIVQQAKEVRKMLDHSKTVVYVAGYERMKPQLDTAFIEIYGSIEQWDLRKAELIAGGRWAEILY